MCCRRSQKPYHRVARISVLLFCIWCTCKGCGNLGNFLVLILSWKGHNIESHPKFEIMEHDYNICFQGWSEMSISLQQDPKQHITKCCTNMLDQNCWLTMKKFSISQLMWTTFIVDHLNIVARWPWYCSFIISLFILLILDQHPPELA